MVWVDRKKKQLIKRAALTERNEKIEGARNNPNNRGQTQCYSLNDCGCTKVLGLSPIIDITSCWEAYTVETETRH